MLAEKVNKSEQLRQRSDQLIKQARELKVDAKELIAQAKKLIATNRRARLKIQTGELSASTLGNSEP